MYLLVFLLLIFTPSSESKQIFHLIHSANRLNIKEDKTHACLTLLKHGSHLIFPQFILTVASCPEYGLPMSTIKCGTFISLRTIQFPLISVLILQDLHQTILLSKNLSSLHLFYIVFQSTVSTSLLDNVSPCCSFSISNLHLNFSLIS